MNRTFISIDWGGSELKGIGFSNNSEPREFRFDSGNLRVLDEAGLREICLKLRNVAEGIGGQANQWLIGAAGADDLVASQKLKQFLLDLDSKAEGVEIYTDYACNHAACLGGADGILTINGTGSVIYGSAGKNAIRTGGWGYLLDTTPSGSYFGRRAIEGVLRHIEGENGYDAFFHAYQQRFGDVERRHIIDELYRSSGIQARLGSFARVLTDAYTAENRYALRMVDDSISKLVAAIAHTMKKCKLSTTRACGSGGLWDNWPAFAELVKAACQAKGLKISWQKRAFKLCHGPLILFAKTDEETMNLIKTLKNLEQSND